MMRAMRRATLASACLLAAAPLCWAQAPPRQTQDDDYTRYELQAPGSAQFRILYEVTATTPGAPFFFNVIRKGSVATDERVIDLATGQRLKWEVVSGAQARTEGHPTADVDAEWIKVYLARPVPQGGETRLLIDKTYTDAKSYFQDGDAVVFDRSLGIRRNAVVLPSGYRLLSLNVPAQVLATPDGRVMISFLNTSAAAAPLVIRARPGLPTFTPALPTAPGPAVAAPLRSHAARLVDRAHDNGELVYDLGDPATHRYQRTLDDTTDRPGVDAYVDAVVPGASISAPSARNLDTGEALAVEVSSGAELAARQGAGQATLAADARAVVVRFPPVADGRSTRVRVTATVTDKARYSLDGDELVWDGILDRNRTVVVLPAGWTIVGSSMPVTIGTDGDGRQRLRFENARPDEMQALVRARRVR